MVCMAQNDENELDKKIFAKLVGTNVNVTDRDGMSAVWYTAIAGHANNKAIDKLKWLIKHNAAVSAPDALGRVRFAVSLEFHHYFCCCFARCQTPLHYSPSQSIL